MTPATLLRRSARILVALVFVAYLAAAVFSITLVFISDDALSGVFAVMLATPWMGIVEALAPAGLWPLVLVSLAMAVNGALILCLYWLLRPRR